MIKDLMIKIKSNATDKQLIEAIKYHNQKAFTIIFNRYYGEIKKHLKIKTSSNSYLESFIDDIVNDTFVTLWENIVSGKYESQGYLKSYLQRISFYKLLKTTKKIKVKPVSTLREVRDEQNELELMELLEGDPIDYNNIAETALNNLKEICLQLIVLKFYDKMSDKEIFDKFSDEYKGEFKEVKNIKSRRSHCMNKLRGDSEKILNIRN
jgi:DNA-directed RNA polymerase specialized sigma24 family protein